MDETPEPAPSPLLDELGIPYPSAFGDPRFEADAVAAVHQASAVKAPAILFKNRGNDGGSTPLDLLAAVMTSPYRGTIVETPQIVAENDAHATLIGRPRRFTNHAVIRTRPNGAERDRLRRPRYRARGWWLRVGM